ncbi:MAG: glycosyltransferase [Bacteroidales bacterium]
MTILILTHSYPDEELKWRGIFIRDQALALSTRHRVIVIYFKVDNYGLRPFSKYSFRCRQNGNLTEYEVITCRSFPVINQVKYLLDTYRFIRKEILSRSKIDIIHCHLSYPAGFLGTLIRQKTNIPCVITEHTWIKKYFRSFIHKWCVIYALKHTARVIAVSQALKNDINVFINVDNYVDNYVDIYVVPNVVDTARFTIAERPESQYLNIGLIGGMSNYRKGADILIRAVALVDDLSLRVHIGGGGKYLDTFRQLAVDLKVSDKCIFYGVVEPEEINNFYSKLDMYVLASRDETFGVVVVEAMVAGLPVIATRCGGPEEIVTPGAGILVANENPEELAGAIRTMSRTLARYDRLAIRKYATEKYGTEAFLESVTGIYEDVVKRFRQN